MKTLWSLRGSIIVSSNGQYSGENLYIDSRGCVYEEDHDRFRVFGQAEKIITPLSWGEDLIETPNEYIKNYPDDPIKVKI